MKLESMGKMLAMGFGDRVLTGIIVGFLDGVTPLRCSEYIKDDTQLCHQVSNSDWQKYRRIARDININDITSKDIIKALKKHRLDILGIIVNTPKGEEWLQNQVELIKKKLSE